MSDSIVTKITNDVNTPLLNGQHEKESSKQDPFADLAWLAEQGARFALPKGRTKSKFDANWQNTPHSADEAIVHARRGGNVGVLTGLHSGNIVALDRDVQFPETCVMLGDLAKTTKIIRINAPDRGKLLYRIKGDIPATTAWTPAGGGHPEAEFLGDNGQRHALCPPSKIDGGAYTLIGREYEILEITPDTLDHIWRLITSESIYKVARSHEQKEIAQQSGDGYIKAVLEAWSTIKIFEHFNKTTQGTADGRRDETRLLGNGGLLIGANGQQWYAHAAQVGGGPVHAWHYCRHGNVGEMTGKAFWDTITEMGDAANIPRPKSAKRQTAKAVSADPETGELPISFDDIMSAIQAIREDEELKPAERKEQILAMFPKSFAHLTKGDAMQLELALGDKMLGLGKKGAERLVAAYMADAKEQRKQTQREAQRQAQRQAREDAKDTELEPRYMTINGAIHERYEMKNPETGEIETGYKPLCNFDARITSNLYKDDGQECSLHFIIAGTLGIVGLPEITIKASEFEQMAWPVQEWGAHIAIEPGRGTRDRLRHAIQTLSAEDGIETKKIFTHTGWRVIDGKRVYLHSAGCIGADTCVSVELPGSLKHYRLPTDDGISAAEAMRKSLAFLEVGEANVTYPLLAAMYAAPLAELLDPGFLVNAEGQSGSFKTTTTALALNHFGDFSERRTPADWLSTPNSLEKMAFLVKDCAFLIDDFRPTTNSKEARDQQAALSRIVRAVGNRAGRSRLDGEAEFHRTFAPRGLVLMTSEIGATGLSTNARMLTIRIEPGDIDPAKLTQAQKTRAAYGYAMRGFIEWLARDWEDLKTKLPVGLLELRNKFSQGQHRRLPDALACLYIGFNAAISYAIELGVINQEQAQHFCQTCYNTLVGISAEQSERIRSQDPALIYLETIIGLIAQQKAYVMGREFRADLGAGELIGWYDTNGVNLMPGAFNLVHQYMTKQDATFPSDEATLRDELHRQGYIISAGEGHRAKLVRVPGNAQQRTRVNVIPYAKFLSVAADMGLREDNLIVPKCENTPAEKKGI